jgi:hypothetical protein
MSDLLSADLAWGLGSENSNRQTAALVLICIMVDREGFFDISSRNRAAAAGEECFPID